MEENHYYLFPTDKARNTNLLSLKAIMIYYLLLNSFIPLNLSVLNMLTKFVYVYFLSSDPQMICEEKSMNQGEI
jgi:peptidoglycan biosynthesis protein MviN/MurJ (putative lipid II flippase)